MIEVADVSKRYGPAVALHPLTLRVEAGETVAIVGESGSGKSTLLRLIGGLDVPTTGQIRHDGKMLASAKGAALRQRLAFVVQGGGLFPHLTARRNITLVAEQSGWTQAKTEERMSSLCGRMHFPEALLGRYPVQLSGGQLQRVALVRSLMLDPEVLMLDEPLGALDPITRHELQDELRGLFRSLGKTVLLVTHDLGEAFYLAGRVWVLQQGRLLQDGSPVKLWNHPEAPYVRELLEAHRCPRPEDAV